MGPTEARRLDMHRELRKLLGDEVTETLMDHLPPDGWSDVARRHDIEMIMLRFDMLDARIESVQFGLNARMDSMDHRMDSMETGLSARIDALGTRVDGLDGRMKWMITSNVTVAISILALVVQMLLAAPR